MPEENIFIIIPCFNEGQTIIKLIREIESILLGRNEKITAVIVDDCSTDDTLSQLLSLQLIGNLSLKILSLQFNLGHQGAIAQGLLFANANKVSHAIVMDGDGEDDPNAIPELLDLKKNDIVHVIRGKRREKLFFRISYSFYKVIFSFLTKKKMNFGNYCLISDKVIAVASSRTFIHLAAFLSRLHFKSVSITFDRRKRIGGNSKMNLASLVHHAFRSFIEYAQSLLMIFLKLFVILFILLIITIGYIVYLKIFTHYPILGWSSTFGIGLLTSALVCMGFFVTGVLLLNLSQHKMNQPSDPIFKVVR
jgi:polyisoprenyl-phosphate glycosyltransferase